MTESLKQDAEALRQYLLDFINEYRKQYSALSDIERTFINNATNYTTPTQIEVFWLKEPCIQYVFVTHFEDIPDTDVVINGPWESHDFLIKAVPALQSTKWGKTLEINHRAFSLVSQTTYGRYVAEILHSVVIIAKNMLFEPKRKTTPLLRPSGSYFPHHSWMESYIGVNMQEIDYHQKVKLIIQDVKEAANLRNRIQQISPPAQTSDQQKKPVAYGTHFFPPIILRDRQIPSVRDILHGIDPNSISNRFGLFNQEIVKVDFGKIKLGFTDDGFIVVYTDDKEKVTNILNMVMGVATLHGVELIAVRENELSRVDYDSDSLRFTGYEYKQQSLRNVQFEQRLEQVFPYTFMTRFVPKETIHNLILKAALLFKNEKLAEDIRIWIIAYSHLKDSEYSQSFIMSWAIIERQISELWESKINTSLIDDDKRKKDLVNNTVYWSIDQRLEVLNLDGLLPNEEFIKIDSLKSKRNKFIHKFQQVPKVDAEECLSVASLIIRKKIALIPTS